jgi:hypothetical protein
VGKTEVGLTHLKFEQTGCGMKSKKMPGISEFTHQFFEEASKSWKANKVKYGQAMYRYKKYAFPGEKEEPLSKQTLASRMRTEKELKKRQSEDEPAPLRERKSPRLRELHLQQTYVQ